MCFDCLGWLLVVVDAHCCVSRLHSYADFCYLGVVGACVVVCLVRVELACLLWLF